MQLRDYQIEAIEALEKESCHSLVVLPTGTGKSELMFGYCLKNINKRLLIVSHKANLVEQTAKRAAPILGVDVSIYCSSLGSKKISPITIASVQSISRVDTEFDTVIVDEAHRLPGKNIKSAYSTLISKMPNARIIGMTATPFRQSGYIYGTDGSWFTHVCYEKHIKEMIEKGYLVRPRLKQVTGSFDTRKVKITAGDYNIGQLGEVVENEEKIKEQIEDALPRLEGRKKIIWACTTIKHAEMVMVALRGRGEVCTTVHSQISKEWRDRNMREFEQGRCRHLTSVTMLSEGINIPAIDALVFMRPTRSPTLYVQTVGRVLRPYKEKADALVLDYGNVVTTLGPIDCLNIGQAKERKINKTIATGKFCEKCLDYNETKAKTCSGCGEPFAMPRDPFKQLTTKHNEDFDILSNKSVEEYIPVKACAFHKQMSKSGRNMIVAYYYSHTRPFPIKEYFTFGNSQKEFWLDIKSLDKIRRLGVSCKNYTDAWEKLSSKNVYIKGITLRNVGKFPEVVRYHV